MEADVLLESLLKEEEFHFIIKQEDSQYHLKAVRSKSLHYIATIHNFLFYQVPEYMERKMM